MLCSKSLKQTDNKKANKAKRDKWWKYNKTGKKKIVNVCGIKMDNIKAGL